MRRAILCVGLGIAFNSSNPVTAETLSQAALEVSRVVYTQGFAQPVAGLRGGQIVNTGEVSGLKSGTRRIPSAVLSLDPLGENAHFPAAFKISLNMPTLLCFNVKATHSGRLVIHLEPDEIPASLQANRAERDWANPTRQYDFRAVVALEPNRWVLVMVDLNRDFFEAVTREKAPYNLAGIRFKAIGFEVNQPSEKGVEVWIDNVRIIELTGPAMKKSLEHRLEDVYARMNQLPSDSAVRRYWKPQVDQWSSRILGFDPRVANIASWQELAKGLDLLWLASNKWQVGSRFGSQYALGVENSLQRVSGRNPLYAFRGKMIDELELEAARNEYESFQLVILPLVGGLSDVVLESGDLTKMDGTEKIPAENWTFCHQLEQQIQTSLRTLAPEAGWTPDALLPISGPFQVADLETKSIWVTLRVPAGAKAGTYQSQITVRPSNGQSQLVRIRLRVHGFQIPEVGRFRTQGHFALSTLSNWYGQKNIPGIRRAFYRLLTEHRFTPTSQYDRILSPVEDDIPWVMGAGGNVVLIGGYSGHELEPDVIEPAYRWLVENNYINLASIYIGDETDDFQGIRKKALTIRQHWPKLRIMVGGSKPRPELEGYVDVWDPITSGGNLYDFDPDSTGAANTRGEEVFWYTCIGPRPPFANIQNDDPLTAIRALWWQAWKYGVTGFEYWWFNWWDSNMELSKGGKPWPLSRIDQWNSRSYTWANGDGLLVYPGPFGQPLSCNRLSVIRDAIEDWEVLFMLARAVEMADKASRPGLEPILKGAKRLLAVPPEITTNLTHWSQNPEDYLQVRHEIYTALESLRKALGSREVDSFTDEWVTAHQHWMQEKFEARVARTRPQ